MKDGSFLEKVTSESTSISLLGRGDGVEIILQTVFKGKLFYLYPSDNNHTMEFFYILNGKMKGEIEGEKVTLGPNDYFSGQGIKEPVHFVAEDEVTYLWVITEPTFHYISKDIKALRDIIVNVEKKDRYTFMHSERVANYSVKVAKELKLPKSQLEELYLAAELHDIGKYKIPSEILNKPSKLTKEEFNVIKKHPEDGADMVKNTNYENIAKVIEQHHERLDGSGYPSGIKEHDILLPSKIIAICDTFDAMTEDRTYRKAFSAQYAMDEIKRLAGTHFDPELVNVFEKILREEGKIE
nr:HD domain-containing phosphohydrolase [Thalassobacillus pellis]